MVVGMGTSKTTIAFLIFGLEFAFLLIQEESNPDFPRPKSQIEDRIGGRLLEGTSPNGRPF